MLRTVVMLLAISPPSDAPKPRVDLKGSPVVAGMNRLAFELFREVGTPAGNVALSPASLAPPFAVAYEGARGATADEIASVFHFPDREAMRRDFQALSARWSDSGSDRAYRLVSANALWGQSGATFRPEYLRLASNVYGAPLTALDFARNPESARRVINAWVSGRTNQLIPALIAKGDLTVDTRLVVTNAVYFKADWFYPFQPEGTHPKPFHVTLDRTIQAPTMGWTKNLYYCQTSDVQAVGLPYRGGEVAMVVVLPRRRDGLAEVERSLTAENLDGWVAAMRPRDVDLDLPKFQAKARLNLNASLGKLGVRTAFESSANFSGITDGPLWISSVVQEVVVKVDEKGTEAAAATVVAAAKAEPPGEPPPPVVFNVDHPFFYVIRDIKSGAILFLGHVVDPTL